MVHPRNDLQNALKASLTSQLQPELSKKGKRFKSFLRKPQASTQGMIAPVPEGATPASLMPGLEFTPLQPMSNDAAYNETNMQLKRADYRAELYGVKDQTASVVKFVFQPWYLELLDMGNLQVSSES